MKTIIFSIIFIIFSEITKAQDLERFSWQCQNPINVLNSEEFTFYKGKFIYTVKDTLSGEVNKTKGTYRTISGKLILKTKKQEVVYSIKWAHPDKFYLSIIASKGYLIYVLSGTPEDKFWMKK